MGRVYRRSGVTMSRTSYSIIKCLFIKFIHKIAIEYHYEPGPRLGVRDKGRKETS